MLKPLCGMRALLVNQTVLLNGVLRTHSKICKLQECNDIPAVKKMLETAKQVLGYDLLQV